MSALSRYTMFRSELQILIAEEIERLKDEMSLGLLKDHQEYKSFTGKILGLRSSLELMDEADTIVSRKIGP